MASAEDRARVRIQPVLLLVICGGAAGLLEYLVPVTVVDPAPALRLVPAVLIFVVAGYFALHAVITLKQHGTHVDPGEPTEIIVTGGPFRLSRNPMYLALLLLMLGLAALLASIWFLALTPPLWLLLDRLAIRPEEAYLEAKFGQTFRDYRARVRRWL